MHSYWPQLSETYRSRRAAVQEELRHGVEAGLSEQRTGPPHARRPVSGDPEVENRNGLIAAAIVTRAGGYAEREDALLVLADKQYGRWRRITVGADKAYDDRQFVEAVRKLNVTPHITKNDKSAAPTWTGRRRGTKATRSS